MAATPTNSAPRTNAPNGTIVPTGTTARLIGGSVRTIAATLTGEILSIPSAQRRDPKFARDFARSVAASPVGKAVAPAALTEGLIRISTALPRESASVAMFAALTGESATAAEIDAAIVLA